jgi:RimJ/RimL family protein N-acetyltransferase
MDNKVRLRSVDDKDIDLLYKWINTPELVSFNSAFKPVSRVQHLQWLGATKASNNVVFFMIDHVESGTTIGSCQLKNINTHHRSAELQIRVGNRDFYGRGMGTDAIRQLINFGFTTLDLHRISLQVFSTNIRAIRAYEKNGFLREGLMREAAYINEEWVDVLLMGLLNKSDLR